MQWNVILQSLTESDRESSTHSSPLNQVFCLSCLLRLHFSHHPNSLLRFSLSGSFFFLFYPASHLSLCFLHNSFQTHPAALLNALSFPCPSSACPSRRRTWDSRLRRYALPCTNLLTFRRNILPLVCVFCLQNCAFTSLRNAPKFIPECRPAHVYRWSRGNLFYCIRLYSEMLAR